MNKGEAICRTVCTKSITYLMWEKPLRWLFLKVGFVGSCQQSPRYLLHENARPQMLVLAVFKNQVNRAAWTNRSFKRNMNQLFIVL